MKITLTKPHALNGKLLPAGAHEIEDATAIHYCTERSIEESISELEHSTLFDKPDADPSKLRVAGPFTVEAVPAPTVRSLDEIETSLGRTLSSSI